MSITGVSLHFCSPEAPSSPEPAGLPAEHASAGAAIAAVAAAVAALGEAVLTACLARRANNSSFSAEAHATDTASTATRAAAEEGERGRGLQRHRERRQRQPTADSGSTVNNHHHLPLLYPGSRRRTAPAACAKASKATVTEAGTGPHSALEGIAWEDVTARG